MRPSAASTRQTPSFQPAESVELEAKRRMRGLGALTQERPERLGLRRVPTMTGDFLCLCDRHYEMKQPPIPDRIG